MHPFCERLKRARSLGAPVDYAAYYQRRRALKVVTEVEGEAIARERRNLGRVGHPEVNKVVAARRIVRGRAQDLKIQTLRQGTLGTSVIGGLAMLLYAFSLRSLLRLRYLRTYSHI